MKKTKMHRKYIMIEKIDEKVKETVVQPGWLALTDII